MSDLTDEELFSIECSLGGPKTVQTSQSETCRMLRELQTLRAAKAADRERVRQVVKEACMAVERTAVTAVHIEKLDAIIDRAAEQLSGAAMPNSQELEQLKYLRSECVVDDYPDAAQFLDRLLGASK